ncbi:MAG: S41 family peptidase [Clostridium sp.]|nr:S41 family peptidase [Clostridium sp.]
MIKSDLYLILIELAFSIGLYFLADYADKVKSTKWKLLYVVPLIVCMAFIAFTGEEISLLSVYIAVIVLLIGFSREEAKLRRLASAIAVLLIIPSILVCNLYKGYRAPNYLQEFKEGFDAMQEHYCLAEHKGIDWDALYEEYEPQFKEVEKKHDAVENYILWTKFCCNFHDGHVAYSLNDRDVLEKAHEIMYGNDYGLSLMTRSDGKTVAVNVEKDSDIYNAGIRNGTVITEWDGRNVEAVINDVEIGYYDGMPYNPVKETEDFYRAVFAAGAGGDSVTIKFIGEDGTEHSVSAEKLGAYADRLERTMSILADGIKADNVTWHELSDDTCILRLTLMMYDTNSSTTGNFSAMKEEVRENMLALQEKGIKNIIIDLRNNGGGDPNFILAIAELLAPEGEHQYAYDSVWDEKEKCYQYDEATGRYIPGNEIAYEGESVWGDGQIVILVSAGTVSAGDHFADIMSIYDNVTIMGFTSSNCSGQAIKGVTFEKGALQFSSVPTLREDGTIYIDTDASRQATIPLDVKVPFDEKAVASMFEAGEDYLMEYAREYIEGQ